MADWYGHHGVSSKNRGGKSKVRDEEFQEEDVWGVAAKGREDSKSPKFRRAKEMHYSSGSSSSSWRSHAAPKVIPRARNGNPEVKMAQQSSAPVSIPDWSKIYRNKSKNGVMVMDDENTTVVENADGNEEEEEEDADDEMVPPHEYIARRLARTQIASFSMCEGVGRTLKGRDLSKLRNAILTKTGFLE
ncbi:hypothetical protein RJ640_005617 [Escallonia rubra]|uniref:Senescence regulator n=1 Tax=Escallonia rubra TaxID=112253 RepID=A0AA88U8T5_9ASTE|nr:hypothetical protein RJ640_005617 [Escallonia rubra]